MPQRIDMSQMAKRLSQMFDRLTGRQFGPGQPLQPQGTPEEMQAPRQYQYPVGANSIVSPRREQPGLSSFEQLRNLASLYDVAAMCIATRIEEIQGLEWAIVPKDKRKQQELQAECDEVTEFWRSPDKLNDLHTWLGMVLYDVLSIDALTIYKRPTISGGLHGLEVVDGATIKPLLDPRGRVVAYQQVLYGYPMSDYRRPEADAPDEEFPTYGTHEMIYKPRWARSFTPYGFPPTEWIILRVNQAIRKQSNDLAWFTDGNIPDMIATPPDGSTLTVNQVVEFEEWFNAVLAGDDAARRKVRFFPWNMVLKELRPFTFETALDEWMLKVTCAAYSVPPQELGFTADINRASADLQEAVNERKGLKPLAKWLKDVLFDPITQRDLKKPYLEMSFKFGDKVDELVQAQSDQVYWNMGVWDEHEIRALRFGDKLNGKAPGKPIQQTGTAPGVAAAGNFFPYP